MRADEPGWPAAYGRVVLDTNVILSAALAPRGAPALLVDRLLQSARVVLSAATFAEFETRLWRPKFDRYLSLQRRRRLLRDLAAGAHWVGLQVARY